eukprot:superscaffoldBa00001259_g9779
MAAAKRLKRVAASQPGFLSLKGSSNSEDLLSGRRKRVNKNKKKNWNKHSDINDVEDFLEDVRHQERTTGGLLSEKPDDSLFFLDVGQPQKAEQKDEEEEPIQGKRRKGKASRPLRIDLILQHDSLVPPPKDVLSYQQPNAKKLRRIAQKAEQLAAKGVVPRRQKQLLNRRPVDRTTKKAVTEANNNPDREYYDIWGQETKESADPWYLQQTGKKLVKEQRRQADRHHTNQRQQLFQLRSIKASIKQQEQTTKTKQKQRNDKKEAQKAQPRRLGRLKFQAQDMEVQLSDELAGSLRQLKPEGSILKDRFKSLQKRNLIEPRERAKFKRRHKVKYVEKRAFREIT